MVAYRKIISGLKEFGLRVAASTVGASLIFILALTGHHFNIKFLQSRGGLLISTIILSEVLFFSLIFIWVLRGEL